MDPVLIQKKVLVIPCWKTAPCHLIPVKTLRLFVSTLVVVKSYSTLCDSMDCSWPGSSVHGISQARIQEWVAIFFFGDLSDAGINPASPALGGRFFTTEPPGKLLLKIYKHNLRLYLNIA